MYFLFVQTFSLMLKFLLKTLKSRVLKSDSLITVVSVCLNSVTKVNVLTFRWDEAGREIFKNQVQSMIDEEKMIAFVLPAFPFKSTNHMEKVLDGLPDVSEKLAVKTLHKYF